MKKLCVLYANCQADGLVHFLKKTRMADDYDFVIWHNWQLMMQEQEVDAFVESVEELKETGGVFIYQPTESYFNKRNELVPSTASLIQQFKQNIRTISFAYQFNHGFFPLVKLGEGWDGWITSEQVKSKLRALHKHKNKDEYAGRFIIMEYLGSGLEETSAHRDLNFDCARRFIECLAEQARREEETDIKMVPWILQNHRKRRLFLTYNHPTSALFEQLARQIITLLVEPEGLWECVAPITPENRGSSISDRIQGFSWTDENEANMNGVMPIHPAVVRELGLEYQPTDNSIEYYRDLLEQMMRELKG